MKTLWIIRGLPGSGKSTLAQHLFSVFSPKGCEWTETDMFFIDGTGNYSFNPSLLDSAHHWCQKRTASALEAGVQNVIVSNTFTTNWEMETYVQMAEAYGYSVQVLHCEGTFENTHKVPEATYQKMKRRWQAYDPSDRLT